MKLHDEQCALCRHKKLRLIVNLHLPIKKCLNCGLTQVSPLPKPTTVNKLYQGNYWKNYLPYGSQEKAHRDYFKNKIREIKKYCQKGKLLDIGCALGSFIDEARNQGFIPEGIDISYYAVIQCRRLGLSVKKGTITDVNKRNYYDLISAFEVIEHEHNPLLSVITANKLLKKSGLLVMTVPDSDTWTSKVMGKYWFGYRNKEHLFHFNRNSLSILLKKAGFSRIIIKTDSPRPYLFTYYLERFNFYIIRSSIFGKFVLWLKKIPILNALEVPLNPWGNLIAIAYKHD